MDKTQLESQMWECLARSKADVIERNVSTRDFESSSRGNMDFRTSWQPSWGLTRNEVCGDPSLCQTCQAGLHWRRSQKIRWSWQETNSMQLPVRDQDEEELIGRMNLKSRNPWLDDIRDKNLKSWNSASKCRFKHEWSFKELTREDRKWQNAHGVGDVWTSHLRKDGWLWAWKSKWNCVSSYDSLDKSRMLWEKLVAKRTPHQL